MTFLLLLILIPIFSGCATGPKDNRSAVEKLNGENYQRPFDIMGIPVLERKPILRQFSGRIFCGERISQYPLSRAVVTLWKSGQRISETSSAADGSYQLNSAIDTGSSYELHVVGRCGTASRALSEKDLLGLSGADFTIN